MTLLVCHRDAAMVTLLADTRISGGLGALTDMGPKIMSVPVVTAHGSEMPEPTARATFGFAYSGSTLAAMSTYALATTCLQTLVTPETPRLPTVAAVVDLFARLGERYIREVHSLFDCFIVGPADDGGEPIAYSITARILDGHLTITPLELDRTRRGLWALGSGASAYMTFAQSRRGQWRTIVESVEAFIRSGMEPTVGGHLQSGRCDSEGFQPFMTLSVDPANGAVSAALLGLSDEELGFVDGLDIGVQALGPRSAFRPGAFARRPIEGQDATYVGYWRSAEYEAEGGKN